MPVIGLNYTKITAERKGMANNIEINTTPKITDIKKTQLKGLGKDVDVLTIGFVFKSTFEPKVGEISVEGHVIYKTDRIKEILKTWKAKKELPMDEHIEIINHLFRKVSIQALNLADAMQLPPVVNFPKVGKK